MKSYHHFTTLERECLLVLLQKNMSLRKIAAELGRSPSTISRELSRNAKEYRPSLAEKRYREQRAHCRRKRILEDPAIRGMVRELIGRHYWSPEQVCERLKKEGSSVSISTSTIYRGFDNGLLWDTLRFYLRHKYKTMGKRRESRKRSCFVKLINNRPKEAQNRTELGHLEGDTITARGTDSCIVTLIDRKSRYLYAGRVPSKKTEDMNSAIVSLLARSKVPIKSITFDQGIEFSHPEALEQQLNIDVFFAHPHSPWEKPSVENINGLLRQFYSKYNALEDVLEEDLNTVVFKLNLRPRKCLGWLSPFEVYFGKVLHLT